MELLGKTKVVVKDGKVIEVDTPIITYCPIFDKARGIKSITSEEVKKNMEFRIKDFGMFTNKRKLEFDAFVSFGVSEIMMTGLKNNIIDGTVTVCDGAGTVITDNPKLVQGMGARMSGLIKTEPIKEVIERIHKQNGIVLDSFTAEINPLKGVEKALKLGMKRIAVSIVHSDTAKKLRKIKLEKNIRLIIIGVHMTGIEKNDAIELIKYADIITSCASKNVRDVIKPLLQVGTSVPLFAITKVGKDFLLERAKDIDTPLLISTAKLPYQSEKAPKELI